MIADSYKIGHGIGRGAERLVAFDNALLNGGVGNYNLVRLSSILPCEAKLKERIELPLGSLLPIAYAHYSSNVAGKVISAAVAIGFPEAPEGKCAVIMEYEGECTADYALRRVQGMVEDAFRARGWNLSHMKSDAIEAAPDGSESVSVFAYVAEWRENND